MLSDQLGYIAKTPLSWKPALVYVDKEPILVKQLSLFHAVVQQDRSYALGNSQVCTRSFSISLLSNRQEEHTRCKGLVLQYTWALFQLKRKNKKCSEPSHIWFRGLSPTYMLLCFMNRCVQNCQGSTRGVHRGDPKSAPSRQKGN